MLSDFRLPMRIVVDFGHGSNFFFLQKKKKVLSVCKSGFKER
jgi:hypothetical protein